MRAPGHHSLFDYYLAGAVNSLSATLFTYCSFFWAKGSYGYSDEWNLRMGAIQGIAAVLSAHFGGKLGDRYGYDRVLKTALPPLVLVLLAGAWLTWFWTPVVFTTLYIAVLVTTWPCLEASVLHAPSRLSMPSRLGYYNIVWASFSAFGFLLAGWVYSWKPAAILWIPAALHGALWLWLCRSTTPAPAAEKRSAMELPHAGANLPAATKRRFLDTALIGNAIAYFLLSGFLALAPRVGDRFGLTPAHAIWLAACVLVTRALAFVIFWRWEGWHYRMKWAQAALWLAPLCMAGVFFLPSLALAVLLLALFGLGLGLTYYTSIYYSLEFGDDKGSGGGRHEAVLGVGILAGPLVGAVATHVTGNVEGGKLAILVLAILASLATTLRHARAAPSS